MHAEREQPISTAVTANFDGVRKHPTRIGDHSHIGAGAILVAPVSVGRDAVVGANAVVTKGHNVSDGQTVVGVRAHPPKKDAQGERAPLRDGPHDSSDGSRRPDHA